MAPPRYERVPDADVEDAQEVQLEIVGQPAATLPPGYNVPSGAAESPAVLPSYEDVQRIKGFRPANTTVIVSTGSPVTTTDDEPGVLPLGDDMSFIGTFLLSFFFNWIGLLLSFCLSHTLAGRGGALSGFGLSLVKAALIFYHFHKLKLEGELTEQQEERLPPYHGWLLCTVSVLGFMLFAYGIFFYTRAKRLARRSALL